MKIVVLRSARKTIADGFWFYENQEAGLGSYFRNSIMADIRSLKLYAGIHQVHFDKYHRLVSRTFPYSIFYRVEESEIRVYAVLDSRRDPDWISDRLR